MVAGYLQKKRLLLHRSELQEQGMVGWDHCRAVRNGKVKRPLHSTTASTNGIIFNRFNRQLAKVPVGENSGENGLSK